MSKDSNPIPPPSSATVDTPLISAESRSHHFGAVVSKSSQKLKHSYRLVNTTKHDIHVRSLVNRKPCCGVVRIGGTMLHPGDETEVEVSISITQEFGDVVHETVVQTEPPQPEDLVLRTTAKAYSAVRIEEVTPINGTVLLSSDKPRPVEFLVIAYGSSTEPIVDLDRVVLRSADRVDWVGLKEEAPSEDGLTVETRRFIAVLDPAGAPGGRRTTIDLQDAERTQLQHIVSWEAVSPITASPKLIVMQLGERHFRVLIHSRDQKLFRVTRVECKTPGVQGRTANSAAALDQIVEVELRGALPPESRRGVVTVFTDHPAQGKVDLSFVMLD